MESGECQREALENVRHGMSSIAPAGPDTFIRRPNQVQNLRGWTPARGKDSATKAGLRIVRWRPVVLREPERPLLGLFGMMRSQDLPESIRNKTWTEPSLIIRTSDGAIHPEYSAVKLSFGFPP